MDGFSIPRTVLESLTATDDFLCRLWAWCLLQAADKPKEIVGLTLAPGQFVTTKRQIAGALRCDGAKAFRGLRSLQSCTEVELKLHRNKTLVTLCHWVTYGGTISSAEPQLNQSCTKVEPSARPRSRVSGDAWRWHAAIPGRLGAVEAIPDRAQEQAHSVDRSGSIEETGTLGEAKACESIERSITAGWIGLFDPGNEERGLFDGAGTQGLGDRLATMLSQASMPVAASATTARSKRLPPRSRPLTTDNRYCQQTPRDTSLVGAATRAALRALVAGKQPWPLFLHGPAGRGKTCAGLCLLDYAGGLYWTMPDFLALLIRATKGQEHGASGQTVHMAGIWKEVESTSLLVLDEIGAKATVSEHHYESLKRVLDARGVQASCSNLESLSRFIGAAVRRSDYFAAGGRHCR